MKQGKSLVDLAAEIQRRAEAKRDFVADTRQLVLVPTPDNGVTLRVDKFGDFAPSTYAHGQLAARTGIDKRYYDRMLSEAPGLLCYNVNHWFQTQPAQQLIRTLDGGTRAVLSDSYRPLDNLNLAEAVLPVLGEQKAHFASCEITDNRLYIKAVTDTLQGEVKKGDVVRFGVAISNSEVGNGKLRVDGFFDTLACTNGMIVASSFGKAHLGRKQSNGNGDGADLGDAFELWSDKTREISDAAFFAQVRDVVKGLFTEAVFKKNLAKLQEAAGREITGNPVQAVEVLGVQLGLTQGERSSVLSHLIKGADLSQYGIANAVTRTAADAENYDRATELERAGGMIIELPRQNWDLIAVAA